MRRSPLRSPRARLTLGPLLVVGLAACWGDFQPTPPPEATLNGTIGGLPGALETRAAGSALTVRAVSVDGAVLAEDRGQIGNSFSLRLGPDRDHFNVRVIVTGGQMVLKHIAPQAPAGQTVELGTVGGASTAATLVVERYAERERNNLASTSPATVSAVFRNALGAEDAVSEFRGLVDQLLDALDPSTGEPSLGLDVPTARADALALAGIQEPVWTAALEAAVDASLVPVVCDPSQVQVLFTVDASGQAKDGNGAAQFLRQPSKEGKMFLGITLDPTSPVPDSAGTLKPRLTPNDPATEMFDDGTQGDEVAGDGVFSRILPLPRGMRVLYKYTNGSPGEGFTGTEEWPGNARILLVEDVITGSASGTPDCLVIRRDSFGDESSNKNFVNLHARLGGGNLGYDDDLGGGPLSAAPSDELLPVGGLALGDIRDVAPLTPAGIPEARENGTCTVCPPPLTVSAEDNQPPRLVAASFVSSDQARVVFSEDVDLSSGGAPGNYLLVDGSGSPVAVRSALVAGNTVTITHDPVDPRQRHDVYVKDVTDASLARNPVPANSFVRLGPDLTPPEILEVRASSIVEVNPAARPGNPESGEVVIVRFSETLDRISAENAENYAIDGLDVLAAFQRGREVLLVTSQQTRNEPYSLEVGTVFDLNGNVALSPEAVPFRGLSLSRVTFKAVPGFAWRSLDGAERGLPPGEDLYLTGTVMLEARALDGADLRVSGRSDVAGVTGFRFEPTEEMWQGQPVYALDLRLPAGTYAFKLAHGTTDDAVDPPATLETVTKNLATRNDVGGVVVDPITLLGRDGISYAGAILSTSGLDTPGPGVLFKRENPDEILIVGENDVSLDARIVGTWRDVPFGPGSDYDDGLTELPLPLAVDGDEQGPRLLGASARDSESVLLSFDEAVFPGNSVTAEVGGEDGPLAVAEVLSGAPLPNQVVLRTSSMDNDTPYSVLIGGFEDALGNVMPALVTAGFTSPPIYSPFQPIIDSVAPVVLSVTAVAPREVEFQFNERVAEETVVPGAFVLSHTQGGTAPVLAADGLRTGSSGRKVTLTFTADMEIQAPYQVIITGVEDTSGNAMDATTLPFAGFGEFDPPEILWAEAMSPTLLALQWNEPLDADSANIVTNYTVDGLVVLGVRAGAALGRPTSAFSPDAPLSTDVVVLEVSQMAAGQSYTVHADGVADLSGNGSVAEATFSGVSQAPTVDVLLTYLISDSATVNGQAPAKGLSVSTLNAQREGVFILGTALLFDGSDPLPDSGHPATLALGGFPAEGEPLLGSETQLKDDGTQGDRQAGDGIYSLLIENVPLGSTLSYKATAPFDYAWAQENITVPGAAFADAAPGPGAWPDGQEFPGHDNAVLIVADTEGDGVVEVNNLFGDEISFKRFSGTPAFRFVIDEARRED